MQLRVNYLQRIIKFRMVTRSTQSAIKNNQPRTVVERMNLAIQDNNSATAMTSKYHLSVACQLLMAMRTAWVWEVLTLTKGHSRMCFIPLKVSA